MYKALDDQVSGTSLQGYLDVTYEELVNKLGKPNSEGDGYKTDAEWQFTTDEGITFTIYNWKDGHNYNGAEGMDVWDIKDWHIGGHDYKAVEAVDKLFPGKVQGSFDRFSRFAQAMGK